jgi:hypothetical protein
MRIHHSSFRVATLPFDTLISVQCMCGRHKESHNLRSGYQENNMASFWLPYELSSKGNYLPSVEKVKSFTKRTRFGIEKLPTFQIKM